MNTEQKITKIVDGDTPSIEASVIQQGATGAVAVSITDGSGSPIVSFGSSEVYTTRVDKPSDTIIYVGDAEVGSDESDAVWRIQKIDKTNPLSIKFADGNASFDNVWTNRASLTYT
jgi:hypothetical protein